MDLGIYELFSTLYLSLKVIKDIEKKKKLIS